MFGKKKRSSSQGYYQSARFHRQLQQARSYKRVVRPPGRSPSSLAKVKINRKAIIGILAAALLFYLIYIPNFLYARNIRFTGVDEQDLPAAAAEVNNYFNGSLFWPQKNLLLLSGARLQQYLVRPQSPLYEARSIKRNFFKRELVIDASVKAPAYVVVTKAGSYIVNNDGTVKAELMFGQQTPQLLTMRVPQANALQVDQSYLSQPLRQALAIIARDFPAAANSAIESYEIPESGAAQAPAILNEASGNSSDGEIPPQVFAPIYETEPLDPPQIIVLAKKNGPQPKGAAADFKVYLALHSDLPHVLKQLQYLLSQLSPDRFNKLNYIDLRTENKSFICLVRTPCAQEQLPVMGPTISVPAPPATNANQPVNSNTNKP